MQTTGAFTSDQNLMTLTKGHGTGNDFVLLWDPEGTLDVPATAVATICHRRTGIGADGFIRAVKTAQSGADVPAGHGTTWFMDYRNHDGSLSEMCGNGVRVFGSFLAAMGAIDVHDPQTQRNGVAVWTRAGAKVLYPELRAGGDQVQWRVDMGTVTFTAPAAACTSGQDCVVDVAGVPEGLPGVSVNVGNPHVVVNLPEHVTLEDLDLHTVPTVSGRRADSDNVEFVVLHETSGEVGAVTLRVHERGAGETLSCGTGACAVAFAARMWAGAGAPQRWLVNVPGGQLTIAFAGDVAWMTGPATLVADLQVPETMLVPPAIPGTL